MASADFPPEGTVFYYYSTNWPKAEATEIKSTDILRIFYDGKLTKHDIPEGSQTIQIGKGFYVTLKKRSLWEGLNKYPVPTELWVRWAVERQVAMPANPERSSHYGFSDEF
jgi:hypothetical protein